MKKPAPKPISLNEEQRAVVGCRRGFWQCLATAGAGKTACLVQRYAALVQEGYSPDSILSLSFTRTAAKNMRDRIEALVGPLSINRTGAGLSTFHAFGLAFAIKERNEFSFDLQEFPLADEPTTNRLASMAARKFDVDARRMRAFVSLAKRGRRRPPEVLRDAEQNSKPEVIKMALAYKEYDKTMRQSGVLDFDSLLVEMLDLLEKKAAVRERYQFEWVMSDESQDNSKTEWDFLKLITQKHGNLFSVGDPSQAIYQFRGSDGQLFANMHEMFPGCQTLYLSTNYRSSPEIVDWIRGYAATPELASRFHTPNAPGPAPRIVGFNSAMEEAAWVVKQIQESV